jgi:hypothetical protein
VLAGRDPLGMINQRQDATLRGIALRCGGINRCQPFRTSNADWLETARPNRAPSRLKRRAGKVDRGPVLVAGAWRWRGTLAHIRRWSLALLPMALDAGAGMPLARSARGLLLSAGNVNSCGWRPPAHYLGFAGVGAGAMIALSLFEEAGVVFLDEDQGSPGGGRGVRLPRH